VMRWQNAKVTARRRVARPRLAALLIAIAAMPAPLLTTTNAAGQTFQLGLEEPMAEGAGPATPLLFERIQASGASIVRGVASWREIAPEGFVEPPGFDARNPADPRYDWTALDAFVRNAVSHGLVPLITLAGAPEWAEGSPADRSQADREWRGAYKPSPSDLGDFAHAFATRYDGRFPDPLNAGRALPRVRFIQVWNEPNYRGYLFPQGEVVHGRTVVAGATRYVAMLNSAYDNIKSVLPTDVVVSAGLGPFGIRDRASQTSPLQDSDPQYFMRAMLCLTGRGPHLRALHGCHLRPRFDVFDQHPYTLAGTPTSKGISPDDGEMGNLAEIAHTLKVAVRLGHVFPAGHKRFWITEFDWWSDPPSTGSSLAPGYDTGKPLPVQARYLSESAYLMWRDGVEVLVWYLLRDASTWPGGLYLAGSTPQQDQPKPALQAFQLPFYAFRSGRRVMVWALAPGRRLRIERQQGSRWVRVADMHAAAGDGHVVYGQVGRVPAGNLRAVALDGPKRGLTSYPFPIR